MKPNTGYVKFVFVDVIEVTKYKGVVLQGRTLYTLLKWHATQEEAVAYAELVRARLDGGEDIGTMEEVDDEQISTLE